MTVRAQVSFCLCFSQYEPQSVDIIVWSSDWELLTSAWGPGQSEPRLRHGASCSLDQQHTLHLHAASPPAHTEHMNQAAAEWSSKMNRSCTLCMCVCVHVRTGERGRNKQTEGMWNVWLHLRLKTCKTSFIMWTEEPPLDLNLSAPPAHSTVHRLLRHI